jgi:6-phosphogluconolactonase
VAYAIDPASGRLSLVGHTPVGGSTPRNFIIDASGKYLLVANQDSDNVRVFKRDKKTGTLTDTGHQATVSMPVCLKMRG